MTMSIIRRTSLLAAVAVTAPITAAAQGSPSLFNPTPWGQMRELSTDRPDRTESPYTVPAGRFQIELDLANLEHDSRNGVAASHLEVGVANIKVGLTTRSDVQFVVAPLVRDRVRVGAAPAAINSGFGDMTFRLKVNVWGNDGGSTALGVMPFVSVSAAEEGESRQSSYGVIVPLGIDVGGGWGVGTMVVMGREPRELSSGKRTFIESSITASHAIAGSVGGYVEFWNVRSAERGIAWQASANGGLTWGLGDNMQIDGGVNVGLTRSTPAMNPFVGFTVRF